MTASAVISAGGFTYLPDPPLVAGENEFHLTLVNLAGNGGEVGWSVTVDRQSQVALLSPLAGQPLGQTTADAGGYSIFTKRLFPADGIIALMATATAGLGNQATTTATLTMALPGRPLGPFATGTVFGL